MDKLFHFQANIQIVRAKGQSNVEYFSEAEAETVSSDSSQIVVKNKNILSSNPFKQDGGYTTDDTSDNENMQLKVTSKTTNGKTSKFKNFSTKQPNGDEGLNHEEEQSSETSPLADIGTNIKLKKSSSILDSSKKEINQSNLSKNSHSISKELKPNKINLVNGHSHHHVDSDAEVKKITAKNELIDHLKNHSYRHLIFSNYISEQSFRNHLSLTHKGLVYAKNCLKGPSAQFLESKLVSVNRPTNSKGKTLFLDLDETLIHSCSLKEKPQHVIQTPNEFGSVQKIGLRIRPYCLEFLQKLSQFWDIVIFTASSQNYAEPIIKFLDPNRKYVSDILNRRHCMETKNGFFIKDLRIIRDLDLRQALIVDNLAHSFGFQPENGVPILEWHNDKNDQELKYLMNYLIQAAQSQNVREFNKQSLKLDLLIGMTPAELNI